MQEANATPATDTVTIDVALLQPASDLPELTQPVVVDGRGRARLDGAKSGAGVGLEITAGRSVVTGLSVTGWRDIGLSLRGPAGDMRILGCRVGIAPDGTVAPNGHGNDSVSAGIAVFNSPGNRIGGAGSDRNIVSGNKGTGIRIFGNAAIGNTVQGNLIGLDSTGTTAVPNTGDGVMVGQRQGASGEGATLTTIGGAGAAGNTIAGNGRTGLVVARATGTVVTGNRIGLAANDTADAVANGDGGLTVHMAPATTVRGNTVSGNTNHGILAAGGATTGLAVVGNRVGTDPTGGAARPNTEHGIALGPAADDSVSPPSPKIGGAGDEGNVVSGNGSWGILVDGSDGAVIRGNKVGVRADGTGQLGNLGPGIGLTDTKNGEIGGAVPGAGNTVGNNQWGVILQDTDARQSPPTSAKSHDNAVQGNTIGVAEDSTPAPNKLDGVQVDGSSRNVIGYDAGGKPQRVCAAPCNLIAANGRSGINIQRAGATGNTVRGNALWLNLGLGIAFTDVNDPPSVIRVPPNDADDKDGGPNGRLNFPTGVLKITQPGNPAYGPGWQTPSSAVTGFTSPPVKGQLIDVYALMKDDDADPWPPTAHSNFGEGRVWIGETTTESDGTFTLALSASDAAAYDRFTATATDPATRATSTFSAVCMPRAGNSADDDADGLCDQREWNGIDDNGDGHLDLDLVARLAQPGHKDLFLEVDQYPGMAARLPALRKVRDAFAAAPVPNPDGTTGISLHIYAGVPPVPGTLEPQTDTTLAVADAPDPLPPNQVAKIKDGSPAHLCDGAFGTTTDRAATWQGKSNCAHVLAARRQVYRYALFADRQAGALDSTGVAETPGNDLVVTLGAWLRSTPVNKAGVPDWLAVGGGFGSECHDRETCLAEVQTGTLMHELGHTLGLLHGGNDQTKNKPNYLSVMNYSLQLHHVAKGRPLDYSHVPLATINEQSLNEKVPLATGHSAGTLRGWTESAFFAHYATRAPPCQLVAVGLWDQPDWNNNATPGEAPRVDRQVSSGTDCHRPGGRTLDGWDDWSHLIMTTRLTGLRPFGGAPPQVGVPGNPTELTGTQLAQWTRGSDRDGDGVPDTTDLCPDVPDRDQTDRDRDGYGDACLALRTTRDLSLTAEARPSAAEGQSPVTLVLTLRNDSPREATAIVTRLSRYHLNDDPAVSTPVTTSHGTYDAGTGQWTVPTLPARTRAELRIRSVTTWSPYYLDAEIVTSGEPDDDSVAGNHLPGEDDQIRLHVDPPLPAGSPRYTALTLTEEGMRAEAMSATGAVVGTGPTPSHDRRALLWSSGSTTAVDLGALSGEESTATAISPNGRIAAGTSTDAEGFTHVVTYTGGGVKDLRRLCAGCEVQVTGVNDKGYVTTADWDQGRWLPTGAITAPDGSRTDLSFGQQGTWPLGIGNDGTAFGQESTCVYEPTTKCGDMAVLWHPDEGGRSELIGTLEGNDSSANARNASGVVAGTGTTAAPPGQALPSRIFTWQKGVFTVLGVPEGTWHAYAIDINRRGVVVGSVNGSAESAVVSVGRTLVDLNNLLVAHQSDRLIQALGISDDGRILVRAGRNSVSPALTMVLIPTTAKAPGS